MQTTAASGSLPGTAALAGAIACGALAARRSHPVVVLVISVLAAETYMALLHGSGGTLIVLAPLIALYTVADTSARRRGLLVCGLAVLALAGVHMLARPTSWMGPENLALAALGALAVAAGDASHNRRLYLAEVEERARRAELNREVEASRRVVEERLRIARDLHDSVGHHLALINVQTGVARFLLETEPDRARTALSHVNSATGDALAQLRDTVGLLRGPGEASAPTEPTVGLAGLADLIASFRRSGLRIVENTDGIERPVPPACDLTAYRVNQESLTNVRKHARHPAARVELRYEPRELSIVVEDSGGPCRPMNAEGHGIIGMRERVAALGGSLRAGPGTTGFRVTATLPIGTS